MIFLVIFTGFARKSLRAVRRQRGAPDQDGYFRIRHREAPACQQGAFFSMKFFHREEKNLTPPQALGDVELFGFFFYQVKALSFLFLHRW